MPLEPSEVESSRAALESRLSTEVPATFAALAVSASKFKSAYASVVSIESWRAYVLEGKIDESALAFFVEAQNDFITSYCLARAGCWRSSLMSLRSALENLLLCLYFKDHLVELSTWPKIKPKGFQELIKYFETYFPFAGPTAVDPYSALHAEYAELSRAVHGSSAAFRMTSGMEVPVIWSANAASCGKWSRRFLKAVRAANLISIHVFASELQGAKNRALREAIGMAGLPKAAVKSAWKVNLPAA